MHNSTNTNKIDRRKKYILMLDTETCNGFMDENGKLDLTFSLVYDIGFAVIDKQGNVYESYSYVLSDVFMGYADIMRSAYYAEKIPNYFDDLRNGTRQSKTAYDIRAKIFELCKKYNCTVVCAHNAKFDINALNCTIRYLTKSKVRYFLPYGVEVWDTLKMAESVISTMPTYRRFCEDNGYMTNHKKPRPRLTAEIIYRFISGLDDFIENHTGLEDVKIEIKILAYCFRKHKAMKKCLYTGKKQKAVYA